MVKKLVVIGLLANKMLTLLLCCVFESLGIRCCRWRFDLHFSCFSPLVRLTSTMMTLSTSTTLKLKQRSAATKKQKRYGTFFFGLFMESFELLRCLTNAIYFIFFQYFLLIQNEKFKNDYVYLSWLARCCMCQNLHT